MMKEFECKCLNGSEPRIIVTEDFVKKNNLSIDKNEAIKIMDEEENIFKHAHEVAAKYLNLSEVEKYLNEEFLKQCKNDEKKWVQITDVFEAAQDFLDYMVFAWEKAMDERGFYAIRSISKLSTWMRILSRKDIAFILTDNRLYAPYGRPALKKACDMLSIKYPSYL